MWETTVSHVTTASRWREARAYPLVRYGEFLQTPAGFTTALVTEESGQSRL